MRRSSSLVAIFLAGCGGGAPTTPNAGRSGATSLGGTLDARPFAAVVAFAQRRSDNGELDIIVRERHVGPEVGCDVSSLFLNDAERRIEIQMPWPVPVGSVWTTRPVAARGMNYAGVHFYVQRGLGGTGQRGLGQLQVIDASPSGGVVSLDVASANEPGGVSGSIRDSIAFTICSN